MMLLCLSSDTCSRGQAASPEFRVLLTLCSKRHWIILGAPAVRRLLLPSLTRRALSTRRALLAAGSSRCFSLLPFELSDEVAHFVARASILQSVDLQIYHLDQAPPLIFADAILQPLVPIALSVRPTRVSEPPLQIFNLAGPTHALSASYLPVTTSSFCSRLALSCASRCAAAALAPYLNHTHSYKACICPVSCTRVQNRSADAPSGLTQTRPDTYS